LAELPGLRALYATVSDIDQSKPISACMKALFKVTGDDLRRKQKRSPALTWKVQQRASCNRENGISGPKQHS